MFGSLIMHIKIKDPIKKSVPALAVIISFPLPPLRTSVPAAPSIVKASVWFVRSILEPEAFAETVWIFESLELSVKEGAPADSKRELVPLPPFIVSASPSPAAAIAIMSLPEPPVRVSVPDPPVIV